LLNDNNLSSLNFRNSNSLTVLSIYNNPGLGEVPYLPPSLDVLCADRKHIIDFDFGRLPRLTGLAIFNGETEQKELKNLPQLYLFNSQN
jgi:hypothetical protein